jgi:hypothetical protein
VFTQADLDYFAANSPDYDRSDELDRLPTRDLIIATARERYPEVFA